MIHYPITTHQADMVAQVLLMLLVMLAVAIRAVQYLGREIGPVAHAVRGRKVAQDSPSAIELAGDFLGRALKYSVLAVACLWLPTTNEWRASDGIASNWQLMQFSVAWIAALNTLILGAAVPCAALRVALRYFDSEIGKSARRESVPLPAAT